MRRFSSADELERLRNKARKIREKQNTPPTVHYFHQVDDPYSHLAVQKLDELKRRYNLKFEAHLVSKPEDKFQGDANHFETWALRDAVSVAPDYATDLSPASKAPTGAGVTRANQTLAAHLESTEFAKVAIEVGTELWTRPGTGENNTGDTNSQAATVALGAGNALRAALGHYQGAMFYFEGEWFWGIDRIRSLEHRLADEGFDSASGALCVPEPTPDPFASEPATSVVLEYFPSLRSPYTAVGQQRVVNMVAESGVTLKVRPVMPMLMRGIPAPQAKQRYIITDAAREGRTHGSPLGRVVDPFGEPVKRAFELFAGAQALGKGMEFVTTYLRAAWVDGHDITKAKVLQQVVEDSGLDFQQTLDATDELDWQALLQDNLDALTAANLWGVPSFRVSGGVSKPPYVCWGQDRIWRVASEIARRS